MTPFHPGSGLSVGLGDRIFGFVFAKRLSSPSPWNVQKTNGGWRLGFAPDGAVVLSSGSKPRETDAGKQTVAPDGAVVGVGWSPSLTRFEVALFSKPEASARKKR
jgi:hypothetical protein